MRAQFQSERASDTKPSFEQMRVAPEQLRTETVQELRPVFTPVQLKKFELLTDKEMSGVVQRLRSTLIVTTFNWPAALDLTLKSIARQSLAPDEVIVADDGSGPETAQVVERWKGRLGAPVHHLWQPHEGFRLARSRNRAIAAASGDYLIIVDGDMVLHRHFVADHLNAARPGSFIQGVRLLTGAATAQRMLDEGSLDLHVFSRGIRRRRHAVRNLALSRLLFWERTGQSAIRGCNQAYWKSDLFHVNGFNEAFVGWGREDNEIAARLYNVGVRRRNLKFQALAVHLHHPPRQPRGVNPNDAILRQAIERGETWCRQGLDRHLVPVFKNRAQPESRENMTGHATEPRKTELRKTELHERLRNIA